MPNHKENNKTSYRPNSKNMDRNSKNIQFRRHPGRHIAKSQ